VYTINLSHAFIAFCFRLDAPGSTGTVTQQKDNKQHTQQPWRKKSSTQVLQRASPATRV
jgi:hypothetical protein